MGGECAQEAAAGGGFGGCGRGQGGVAAGEDFGLLLHVEGGEVADGGWGRAGVGAAAQVAAACGEDEAAEPGFEAVLPLPDVGEFVDGPLGETAAERRGSRGRPQWMRTAG